VEQLAGGKLLLHGLHHWLAVSRVDLTDVITTKVRSLMKIRLLAYLTVHDDDEFVHARLTMIGWWVIPWYCVYVCYANQPDML